MVECSTSPGCITSDLGLKFPRECCIDTPTGLAYTIPDSDVCYVCIGKLIEQIIFVIRRSLATCMIMNSLWLAK